MLFKKLQIGLLILLSMSVFSCQNGSQNPKEEKQELLPKDYTPTEIAQTLQEIRKGIQTKTMIIPDFDGDTLTTGDTLKFKMYLDGATYIREFAKKNDLKYEEIYKYELPSSEELRIKRTDIHNDTAYSSYVINEKTTGTIEKRELLFIIGASFRTKYDTFFINRMTYYVK